jgi:transposase InsO family protein
VQRDDPVGAHTRRVQRAHHVVAGPRKVWRQLRADGAVVARCTVARLMRAAGLQGVVRGGRVRTTRRAEDPTTAPQDLVQRQFAAERPNQLWLADFTYVATWRGFVYVAFVIDAFSRRIVGWRAHTTMRTDLVLDALEQALQVRETDLALLHHSVEGRNTC